MKRKEQTSVKEDVIFKVSGLTKVYEMGEVKVHALRGIDLELYAGLLSLIASLLVSSAADNLIYSISISGYLFALIAVCHKLNSLKLHELLI